MVVEDIDDGGAPAPQKQMVTVKPSGKAPPNLNASGSRSKVNIAPSPVILGSDDEEDNSHEVIEEDDDEYDDEDTTRPAKDPKEAKSKRLREFITSYRND